MAQLIFHVARTLKTTLTTTLLLCGLIVACSDDQGPAVPFKLGEPEHHAPATETQPSDTAADPSAPQADDPSLRLGAAPNGAITLDRFTNNAPTTLATLTTMPPGCSLKSGRVTRLSGSHLWASADVDCPLPASTSDKDPPATATQATQEHWILEDSVAPRVLEQVRLHPPSAGAPIDDIRLTLRSEDVDHDGNPDVIGAFALTSPIDAVQAVELRWLNRASGLDRDENEPEATLAKLAKQAKATAETNPLRDVALGGALLIYNVLCAESGQVRIEVSQHMGVRCTPSAGAGLAWALHAAGRADTVDALTAVSDFERLSDPALKVSAGDRQAVKVALEARALRSPWQWKAGPEIAEVAAPSVRLPQVGFVDDNTLLLRGRTQQSFDITTETISELSPDAGDVLVRDPTQRFAVVGMERRCDGLHLKIASASQVVGGQVLGQPVSEPLFDRAADAARCDPRRSATRVQSSGGFSVLGWAPKGIVVARGPDRRFVPIDSNGQPAGEVVSLGAVLPLPGPWTAGRCASDGSACVTASEVGLALQTTTDTVGRLIAPLGPVSSADVAVAPSGKYIAYVFGGRVFIGSPAPTTP